LAYQETGRFGRITKHLRKLGCEEHMESILHDSGEFSTLKKVEQAKYVEVVVGRMTEGLGQEMTDRVLYECGAQCCGKSWSNFAKRIRQASSSLADFVDNLNKEEAKYNTRIEYCSLENSVVVERTKCICGLVNKGLPFESNSSFCNCSIGHMAKFFSTVFNVDKVELEETISAGSNRCRWKILLQK